MKPSLSLLARSLLKLSCAALLLGSAAQARHDACDVEAHTGSCVTRVAAVDVRDAAVRNEAGAGTATLALWQPDRRVEAVTVAKTRPAPDAEPALTAGPGEPPLLGLLLAVLGVVGFVAHRRSGR